MKVCNYNVIDTYNLGDRQSAPWHYFPWLGDQIRDIRKPLLPDFRDYISVIGGGGLLCNDMLDNVRQLCCETPAIVWGIGTNMIQARSLHYPTWLAKARLLGLRDVGANQVFPSAQWVPCASCCACEFDHLFERTRYGHTPAVFYHHGKTNLPYYEHVPMMGNYDRVTLEQALYFLTLGDVVVTDSYHGAYWSQLLQKPVVIANPFASRFYHMQDSPGLCDSRDLATLIAAAVAPKAGFLAACRAANQQFAQQVRSAIATLA